MKKINKAIGWQKYEDFVEKQLSSPLLNIIIEHMASRMSQDKQQEFTEEDDDTSHMHDSNLMMPISPQLIEDLTMVSNFDCWIGHTNFDITPRVKEKLDTIEGIELLKVCSRYRFFIGVGHMFDFKDVRKSIEKELITNKGD